MILKPKTTTLEDNLTVEEKADLAAKCVAITADQTLSALDRANRISAARIEAQKNHKGIS